MRCNNYEQADGREQFESFGRFCTSFNDLEKNINGNYRNQAMEFLGDCIENLDCDILKRK